MLQPKRQLLAACIGFLLACAGVLLRLNAKTLSMQTSAPSAVIAPGGKSLGGSISFSFENTARTAALTDIAMVLLYAGAVMLVVAISTWIFVSHSALPPEQNSQAKDSNIKPASRLRFGLRWPIWKRGTDGANASTK